MHSHLNIVVPSSCMLILAPLFMHAPSVFVLTYECGLMLPSCTLPNTQKWVEKGTFAPIPCTLHTPCRTLFRASYGSCFVEYCSTVLSVRCRPSSVNIDLTIHSRPNSRKSGTMLHIGVVDMRTTSFVIVISYYTSNKIMYY